jgi:Peptidase family M48
MAGSQTAFDAEQEIAQLVADHAAGCAKVACAAKDASLDIALDMIIFPAAVLIVALLLQRAGFWDGLLRALIARLRRPWLAEAGFGAVLAVLFVAVSLPFGLYDVLTADPAMQSGFRCSEWIKDCPIPKITHASMVENFLEMQLWYALGLAALFAVLGPIAFGLARGRPLVLLAIVAGAYLLWVIVPHQAMWKQTYPLPDGPLKSDIAQIAQRAGIGMDRVLMGQPKTLMVDGGGGNAQWLGGEAKAVISERLLNIHMDNPRAISPPQGPYSAGEFRAVAAHEIAHIQHRHREWGDGATIILAALFAGLAFAVASKVTARADGEMGAGFLPVLLAVGLTLHFVLGPIQRNLWRVFENHADATALDLARDPDGRIAFTLHSSRGQPLVLDRWYHVLYRTHPDDMTRLRRAVEWKARNVPDDWSAQGLTGPIRVRQGDNLELVTDWPEKTAE